MIIFYRSTAFCFLLMLVLSGCSTQAPRPQSVRIADYGLAVSKLDEERLWPEAQLAYLQNANLYLQVGSDQAVDYRVAPLGSGFDNNGASPRKLRGQAGSKTVVELEGLTGEQWTPETGTEVQIFGVGHWQHILEQAQISVTPTDRRYGAVVNVLNEQDLFHYYDELGTLRTVPIIYKPESVRVKSTYRLDQVIAETMPGIRNTLSGASAPLPYALINTGDESEGGFPFVFLDFDMQQAFFLRSLPADWSSKARSPVATTIEATTHITTSHVRVIFEQPVTALTRLFTLATRTTTGMLDPRGRLPITEGVIPPLNEGPGMDLAEWEATLDRMTGRSPPAGSIKILIDGEEFFPRLIDAITEAEQSLQLRTYIFDNDDYAIRFADLLKRRSTDIDIRVMVDGLGTIGGAAAQPEYQPSTGTGGGRSGGSVVQYLKQDSKVKVRVLSNPWFTGDHTKSIIVDERVAFIGGMNIGREYRYEWHDMMVELGGPVVDVLRKDFEKTWVRQRALGDLLALLKVVKPVNAAAEDMYPVRVLMTSARDTQILKAQIAAIRASQKRIYIQNAYFTSDAILYELVMARRRGVDVRVILPLRSDSGLIDRANAIAANKMIANGIRVYIFPGMSHIKGAIYDGWACLGSANFDALSLQVNRELNIATSHPPVVDELLQRVFLDDMERSVELTEPFPSEWWDFLSGLIADVL